MAIQVYLCPKCNKTFEVRVPMGGEVPKTAPCPHGPHVGEWTPSVPGGIIVKDGTGAGRNDR